MACVRSTVRYGGTNRNGVGRFTQKSRGKIVLLPPFLVYEFLRFPKGLGVTLGHTSLRLGRILRPRKTEVSGRKGHGERRVGMMHSVGHDCLGFLYSVQSEYGPGP